jgi:hypothetical protein
MFNKGVTNQNKKIVKVYNKIDKICFSSLLYLTAFVFQTLSLALPKPSS